MKHFGPVVRGLRGTRPLREVAAKIGISRSYLANIEAGRRILPELRAIQLLQRGFDLCEAEARDLLMEVHMLDHGLEDEELRRLVRKMASGELPPEVMNAFRQICSNPSALTSTYRETPSP